MSAPRIILAGAFIIALSGCIVEDSVVCPAVVKPAIRLVISIPDPNAHRDWVGKVVVRDGPYIEVLDAYPLTRAGDVASFQADGAAERPGVYNVSVRRTGYEDWIAVGVVAPAGDCGVVTQRFTVTLVKKQ